LSAAMFFRAMVDVEQQVKRTTVAVNTLTGYRLKYEQYLSDLSKQTTGFYVGATLLLRLQAMVQRQEAARRANRLSEYFELNNQIIQVVKAINVWLGKQGRRFDLNEFEAFLRRGGDVTSFIQPTTVSDAKSLFPLGTVVDLDSSRAKGSLP
jgi:hypothetical protein